MRWWGIGRGYFRNAVAVALLVLLAGTFVVLLTVQRTLRPLMITARKGPLPPLAEQVMVQSDSIPDRYWLGDWMVFAGICDSCTRVATLLAQATTDCSAIERIHRRVQRELAVQLNRYGWSAAQFRAYHVAAVAYHRDTIPARFRWIERCGLRHVPPPEIPVDSTQAPLVRPLLEGRTWWLQLGLADDYQPLQTSMGEGR